MRSAAATERWGAEERGDVTSPLNEGRSHFPDQESFQGSERARQRQSRRADHRTSVERVAQVESPAPPMHILTNSPPRRASQRLDPGCVPGTAGLAPPSLPTGWGEHTTQRGQYDVFIGQDMLPNATRALSPQPRRVPSMFKGQFNPGRVNPGSSVQMGRRKVSISYDSFNGTEPPKSQGHHELSSTRWMSVSTPYTELAHEGISEEPSTTSIGSKKRSDSESVRSKSSTGFVRKKRTEQSKHATPYLQELSRNQLDKLSMENLRELARTRSPDELQQMAIWSTVGRPSTAEQLAFTGARPSSQMSNRQQGAGLFLAAKRSSSQLGMDGYGAPPELSEDIDEILERKEHKNASETERIRRETLRSTAASPALKHSLKHLQLEDGFINPTSVELLTDTMKTSTVPFLMLKPVVIPKDKLSRERAQDVMHDTPAYKRPSCGFNMRGEMQVYSWAAPHNFRGQHANPRIHAPEIPLAPATSAKAKFKSNADDDEKMRQLAERVMADSKYQAPALIRSCDHRGVGVFSTPAGSGRPTHAVKNAKDHSLGYHKYLSTAFTVHRERNISAKKELSFLAKAPMIQDDKGFVASEFEPLRGEWLRPPDMYPNGLTPTATRFEYVKRLNQEDLKHESPHDSMFFVKESVNRKLPGTQNAVGAHMPYKLSKEVGVYKMPAGIRDVRENGLGFRSETPGLV